MEVAAHMESTKDLADGLDRDIALMAAAQAAALRKIAIYDDRKLWERDGATSMASWLAGRHGFAWGNAREWVRVAHALRDLPEIAEAFGSGGLSFDQVRPLTRFATPESDEYLAKRAPERSPASLWREARRHGRVRQKEAADARRLRYLRFIRDDELPVVWLEGSVPAEEGAALEAALQQRAEEITVEDGVLDPGGARLADALVELVTGATEAPRPTLVVHADARVLAGTEPPEGPVLAETEQGDRLDRDAVRRLACDARIEWVLESHGRPVGIGRRGRQVPAHIGRVLRHRDGTCRFPGCERKRWLRSHHLRHWADGGPTNLDNLVLLCHAHHRLLHEGGWSTSGHPGKNLRFHDPGGRPLQTVRHGLGPEIRARYFP